VNITTGDKKSWQCGGCGKWKAPHVEECGCDQIAVPHILIGHPQMPYVQPPILPPTQPWPGERPYWEPTFATKCVKASDTNAQIYNS